MAEDTSKKRTFEVNGTKYAVRVPSVDAIKRANEVRATTFNEALSRGDLLRDQLEGELRKRKLWNDERENEYQTLRQEVLDGEFKLKKGGIKLNQARSIALQMSAKREQMIELLSSRTDLDSNTCEGKADAMRFNSLFASCLVYDETGEAYFPNGLDDYLLKQEDEVAGAGAGEFYYLISGSDNLDAKLPENQFLHNFNFIDEKLRLIDNDGRLIAEDGKHIDEHGNYIQWHKDGTSTKVDPSGRAVNADGDFDVEHTAFLDDDGSPIDEAIFKDKETVEEVEATDTEEAKPKPKRRAKKATADKKSELAETEVETNT